MLCLCICIHEINCKYTILHIYLIKYKKVCAYVHVKTICTDYIYIYI